jgi:hypothetical protein
MAVTGSGTPNGWPDKCQDHNMTYNKTTKVWTVTLNLSANELKVQS